MSSTTDDRRVWHKKEVFTLIQMYESMPELWNINISDYRDRKKKLQSLSKLAEHFDTSTDEIKRKMHNLRCQFNAELKKLKKKSEENNIEVTLIYSEWTYFEAMKYLSDIYNGLERRPIEVNGNTDSENSDIDQDETVESKHVTEPEKVFIRNPAESSTRKSKADADHSIFGEYVAYEMRCLNERNAKKLKLLISKAILQVSEEQFNTEHETSFEDSETGQYNLSN